MIDRDAGIGTNDYKLLDAHAETLRVHATRLLNRRCRPLHKYPDLKYAMALLINRPKCKVQ